MAQKRVLTFTNNIHDQNPAYSYISRKVGRKSARDILKGIVVGFESTVLQRNLKECIRGLGRMFASAKGKEPK